MGLILRFPFIPSPWGLNCSDNGLAALADVDVLNGNLLIVALFVVVSSMFDGSGCLRGSEHLVDRLLCLSPGPAIHFSGFF